MEILLHENQLVVAFIYFTICFLQPILLPFPEAATVGAGSAVLGSFPAACIGFVGTLSGIIFAYFIAKFGGQTIIRKWVKDHHLKQYERYVSRNEISILFILFMIPILPDEIICIGAGLSGVSFRRFLIIACIAKLITSFSLAYSVNFAQSLALTETQFSFLVIGILGIVLLTTVISKKMLLKRNNT
ncbi:TVP38/TMEM64 family protein [Neobacillus niacini]|uniref:TVP38/TMEM64 family protein n=1 Tax=Neobacillus niacini TaxID=86668 RepID=UPI0020425452|nr:VTT domain-containing protein [Neobacillus niacini]MCM3690842.1 VTT domain-containing protein [Neobacillus niacini]